jgi:hypothetical protein
VYLFLISKFIGEKQSKKKQSLFILSVMNSNTASSSAGGAGSADASAPRRNSKRPKCNFLSKTSFFVVFCGVLVPFMSTHLLFCCFFHGFFFFSLYLSV